MKPRCVISLCGNALPVLLVLAWSLGEVTTATGNHFEICHSSKNCTWPHQCVDFRCTCARGYDVTDRGCELRYSKLGERCEDRINCPPNADCFEGHCKCRDGFTELQAKCLKTALPGEACEYAEQCPRLATCEDGWCVCLQGTRTTTTSCITSKSPIRTMKSLEVYKAAMIVAACLMVVVLLAFLACVIKKSFFDSGPALHPSVFTVSENVEVPRAVCEKPPSYEDVVRLSVHQEEPPSYRDVMAACGSSHNPAFVPDF